MENTVIQDILKKFDQSQKTQIFIKNPKTPDKTEKKSSEKKQQWQHWWERWSHAASVATLC